MLPEAYDWMIPEAYDWMIPEAYDWMLPEAYDQSIKYDQSLPKTAIIPAL
jgi:hypothetical protein